MPILMSVHIHDAGVVQARSVTTGRNILPVGCLLSQRTIGCESSIVTARPPTCSPGPTCRRPCAMADDPDPAPSCPTATVMQMATPV
jgi:hypothetical protein